MSEEERIVLTKKRWAVLAASCLINLCIGSLYAWSVFAAPMAEHLSEISQSNELNTGSLAIVFTVANSVGPITLISGGAVNDRFGPKWVIFSGGLLFGSGMIFAGFATNIGMLIVGYGLGCGLAMGLVYGCTISNSVKFFPDKRGLVGGIATASYGISSVLIPPIANILIEKTGVLNSFRILGIAFIVVICSGSFFIRQCPKEFMPIGYQLSTQHADGVKGHQKNWSQMLKDPIFYIMILLMTCGAVFGLMTISQASSIAQNMIGMTVAAGTAAVSVLALFNAAGRVLAGYVSDVIGRINMLTIMLTVAMLGLLLLYFSGQGDVVSFYIGISIIGLCFGAFMGVYPGFTADQFGAKNNSVNYGIMFIGFAFAGYVGPTIMSKLYASTGAYQSTFLAAIALAIMGLLLSMIYRFRC